MTASLINPANFLTILRILLVPLFVGLMLYGELFWAFVVFSGAALTDFFDGLLARRFNWVTPLGVVLDPVGDKMLVVSAFLTMSAQGRIPIWMAILALTREVLVVSGIALLGGFAGKNDIKSAIKSSKFGMLGTLVVMFSLAFCLGLEGGLFPQGWKMPLILILGAGVLLNLASGVDYALQGFRYYSLHKNDEKP